MYEHKRQTDTHRDTHRDTHTPHDSIGHACIASCGKKLLHSNIEHLLKLVKW